MSWINVGEVFYVVRRATSDAQADSTVRDLCDVATAELPDTERVLAAARIKADYPLAYADATAVALHPALDRRPGTASCRRTLGTARPALTPRAGVEQPAGEPAQRCAARESARLRCGRPAY